MGYVVLAYFIIPELGTKKNSPVGIAEILCRGLRTLEQGLTISLHLLLYVRWQL